MAPYIGNDSLPPLPTGGPTAGGDEFDDLFDYEVGGADDPFADMDAVLKPKPAETGASKATAAGLGIDEAVEVAKKVRAPRVKLDEQR
jgi:replication fork protection complex subunit Csm3/Swi3